MHRTRNPAVTTVSRRSLLRASATAAVASALAAPTLLSRTDAFAAANPGEGNLGLWAMKNFKGGAQQAAIEAGKEVYSRALAKAGIPTPEAIFGNLLDEMGLPSASADPNAGIHQRLDAIQQQLETVNRTLDVIQDRIRDLERQLGIAVLKINVHTSEEELKRHVNDLDRLFGKNGRSHGTRVSLVSLVANAMQGRASNIAAFRSAVENDVQVSIDGISDVLTVKVAGNGGLLEQWTGLLAAQIPPDGKSTEKQQRERLVQSYRLLETYFKEALGAQLKGVLMRAAASRSSSADAALRSARADFQDTLENELDLFLSNVERLVFSAVPYAGSWLPHPLAVLRRADLFVAGLRAAWSEQGGSLQSLFGGNFGRLLVSETDICDSGNCYVARGSRPGMHRVGGPNGSDVLAALPGVRVQTRNVKWLDNAEGPYPTVDPAPQYVRIVRLRTTANPMRMPDIPGRPAGSQPPDVKQYISFPIDLVTLEQVTGADATPIFAGVYVDGSRVLTGPPGRAVAAQSNEIKPAAFTELTDQQVGRTEGFLDARKASAPVYVNKFTLVLKSAHGIKFLPDTVDGQPGVLRQTTRTPLFKTQEDAKLALLVSGSLSLITSNYMNGPQCNHRLILSITGTLGAKVLVYDSAGSVLDIWERQASGNPIASFDQVTPLEAKANEQYDLSIEFITTYRGVVGRNDLFIRERVELALDAVVPLHAQGVGFDI